MRLIIKLILCLCFVPAGVFGQERITKVNAGMNGDQFRIIVAFIAPMETMYKMQTMIIDLDPVKNSGDQPNAVLVDLTSTARTFTSGAKNQRILHLRWNKSGETETHCDGKWIKKDPDEATGKIIEAVKAVIRNISPKAKPTDELTLPADVEQKAFAALDSLMTVNLPCLRTGV